MATTFPLGPTDGQTTLISGKQYVWDDSKKRWELTALLDTYTNELPVVIEEVDEPGVGRTVDHSFTIKELYGYETIT